MCVCVCACVVQWQEALVDECQDGISVASHEPVVHWQQGEVPHTSPSRYLVSQTHIRTHTYDNRVALGSDMANDPSALSSSMQMSPLNRGGSGYRNLYDIPRGQGCLNDRQGHTDRDRQTGTDRH